MVLLYMKRIFDWSKKSVKYFSLAGVVCVLCAMFFLTGCESKVYVKFLQNELNQEKAIQVEYDLKIGNEIYNFVRTLQGTSENISGGAGGSGEESFFDVSEIKKEFATIGIKNVTITSANAKALNIRTTISLDEKNILRQSGCITPTGNIVLSAKELCSLYELLPDTVQQYIDLFMAPVFVGDEMSSEEYEQLLSSVYGADFANEIKKAKIFVQVEKAGTKKEKSLPLIDFLTMGVKGVL